MILPRNARRSALSNIDALARVTRLSPLEIEQRIAAVDQRTITTQEDLEEYALESAARAGMSLDELLERVIRLRQAVAKESTRQ